MEDRHQPIRRNGSLPLALIFVLVALSIPFLTSSAAVHDLLRRHGLPGGLLPKEVQSFHYDAESGGLEVRLERPCYATYDARSRFDEVVTGNLSYGELRGLVGVSQEELFLWLPVRTIVVQGPSGVIMFDIGVVSKLMPAALFDEPPDCTGGIAGEGETELEELLGV